MKKFGELIVKFRYIIIILCFALVIPSVIGIVNTRINYDILSYLPKDIDTMKGQDILEEEFGKGAYAMFVCNGMESKDVVALKEKLEKVDHVDNVLWYDSLIDTSIPKEMLPDEVTDVFYSKDGQGTLMFIFFDTTTSDDATLKALEDIRAIAKKDCFISGMTSIVEDTKLLIEEEMVWYVVIAAVLSGIILSLTLDSFLIPILILLNIGMSILYNLGSNYFRGSISFLTLSLVAVLQLAVTMDYSIFLYSSYKEEKSLGLEPKEAMASAIAKTFVSITGSSLTTIAGFIALCFMTFTLGLDLGIVMAKGVIFGVISCVTLLPSFILVMDKWILKTSHKAFQLKTDGICNFVNKHARIIFVVMLILWVPAAYGNSHYDVYYKLDASLPDRMGCVQGAKAMEDFDMASISMILVNKDLSTKDVNMMVDEIDNLDGINFCLGLDTVLGASIPSEIVPDEAKDLLESDHWKLLMLSSKYEIATDEVNNQIDAIDTIIKKYDPNGMIIGETAGTKDLIQICDHDFKVVNSVSIAAIFVILLLVLRSITLPVILVAVIELAIYINMGMSFYLGQTLPFIASVCIGTIQLGATVDYAILMTNRYKTERIAGADKIEATKIALSTSIHSIMTSAIGMFAATGGVGFYSSCDMVGSICTLLGRGAIVSMFIVIFCLPPMYLLFDKLICKTTWGMGKCTKKIAVKN